MYGVYFRCSMCGNFRIPLSAVMSMAFFRMTEGNNYAQVKKRLFVYAS